ncbi:MULTISPECIES: acylneuraminate cytidylyltransferase family protein [unclassified Prochlorococcus]|uniref:acylneuraminate cytidylyltransferase family protein n=1 Tax=unclassified Prochlorococcus TaxID=2627481 RepID=UPI00097CCBC6|nr:MULTISPECIES: acylneuraminate cytidylyltransferase family protein [unclassified Prochlorococcus]AQL29791.1 hypothetical protein BSR22_00730 [Prochlorococcus sp. RS50]AQL31578.1 hypothetical protein BS620_00745 [Prochlorococcus sp. RS01]AQL34530.1 hypothetical protein BS621_07065 [Prochlorococcus sp. RS04]
MQKIAFIPARSGSKRFPDKNIAKLNGKPLIVWAVEEFLATNCFDKIIFSSDSENYFKVLKDFINSDLLVFHKRSEKEAGDKIKIFDYVKDNIYNWCSNDDLFVLGLPTCPFRKAIHIKECINLSLKANKSVFSSCEYDFHVQFAFSPRFQKDQIIGWDSPFSNSPLLTGNTRSQDQTSYLHPNGAIYVIKPNLIKEETKTFYENSLPYIMTRSESIDIDAKEDLEIAEIYSKKYE